MRRMPTNVHFAVIQHQSTVSERRRAHPQERQFGDDDAFEEFGAFREWVVARHGCRRVRF